MSIEAKVTTKQSVYAEISEPKVYIVDWSEKDSTFGGRFDIGEAGLTCGLLLLQ